MLDLDPASKTYDSKSFPVSVATNNITGYKLSVSTTGDITDLTRDISSDTTTLPTYTIPTLDSGSSYAAPSDFPANKWGYKKDSGNYIPFSSPTPLLENTTATNGDTTTLSFASKIDYTLASGAYKTTLIFTATTNPIVHYMQDLNPALCTTTPMTVVDKRDNKEYTIAKLADGNCWLLENLRLDISDPSVQAKLTSATTNATDETLNYLKNGGGSGQYPANGVIAKTASGGSWADDYANPYIATQYENTIQPASGSSPAGKIGIYYNFCAASAGSYCYAINASSGDASQDICPSGWRMPTGGTSGEYQALYTAYSSNVTNFQSALSTPLSGVFYSGTAGNQGTYGGFWSPTRYSDNSMFSLYVGSSSVNPQRNLNRSYGFSVRCILNIPTMQDFSASDAQAMGEGESTILKDVRDNNTYTVAKIGGNVWMTQNLRYQGDTVGSTSTTTSWIMKSATSNISEDTTMTMTDLTAGNSYDVARYHVPTSTQIPSGLTANDIGVWYNYAAASAMTITGSSNENPQTYDICPKGWRLPTDTEQSGITSYASAYSPVAVGNYSYGAFNDTGNGYWWSSTSGSAAGRYLLNWNGSSLNTIIGIRYGGNYVRCIRSS